MSNESHFNKSRGVRPFSPPRSISRAEGIVDEFGGPLLSRDEDQDESSAAWAAAALPNVAAQDFGTLDTAEAQNDGASEDTKYKDVGGQKDGTAEGEKEEDEEEESDADDAATMTPKLSESQRLLREKESAVGSRPGTRERRWSVTDDDVVSE